MASWRQRMTNVGALGLMLTAASPSFPQSGSAADQSGIVIFWDAAKCFGGYETNSYSAHCEPGPPTPPSQITWSPECWKAPLGFDVGPNTAILAPQYSQTPPPNYYMTMNVVVLYDEAKPSIKACLVPLFPRFPVQPACADAQIRS